MPKIIEDHPIVKVIDIAVKKLQEKSLLDQLAWIWLFFNTLGLITILQILLLKK